MTRIRSWLWLFSGESPLSCSFPLDSGKRPTSLNVYGACRVLGCGVRVKGVGCRVQGLGCRGLCSEKTHVEVQGLGLNVQRVGCRVGAGEKCILGSMMEPSSSVSVDWATPVRALASRWKSVKPFKLFPVRSLAETVNPSEAEL